MQNVVSSLKSAENDLSLIDMVVSYVGR